MLPTWFSKNQAQVVLPPRRPAHLRLEMGNT